MTTSEGVLLPFSGVGISASWGLSFTPTNPALAFAGVGVGGSFGTGLVTDPALPFSGVGLFGAFGFGVIDTSGTVTILSFSGVGAGWSLGSCSAAVNFGPSFFATYYQPAGESVSFGSVMGQSVSFGSVAGQSVSFPSEQA